LCVGGFRQAAAKKILGAWQRARNEQKESKQELKDTQRAVQALQQQGSSRAGGEVQDKGQPAPVTAGCGGRIGCRGRIEGGRGGGNRSKKQVSTVSLGSSASGALSAVSQQGQLGHHKKKRKTAHQKCDAERPSQISVTPRECVFITAVPITGRVVPQARVRKLS